MEQFTAYVLEGKAQWIILVNMIQRSLSLCIEIVKTLLTKKEKMALQLHLKGSFCKVKPFHGKLEIRWPPYNLSVLWTGW